MGSLHDAEDLVQETMLRTWQHFDTFKGVASLRTWLYTIATNACLDALKKRPPRTLPVAAYPALDPLSPIAPALAETLWLEPLPDSWLTEAADNIYLEMSSSFAHLQTAREVARRVPTHKFMF